MDKDQSLFCSVKDLTVITVTYNSKREIEGFVDSLDHQNANVHLWIIDNASSDGTAGLLKLLAKKHPWIDIELKKENVGLAAANNHPLNLIKSKYTAIINPDVVINGSAISTLVQYLEDNPDVVAVAPVNVDSEGRPHSSFHKKWTLAHLVVWRLLPASITQWMYRSFRVYEEQDVLFASGACIVFRTDDFKRIGGYDPEYFLTVEDVCDLCIRLRQGGGSKRVVVTPTASITHYRSRSASLVPFITLWNGARGSIYHFHKHNGFASGLAAYIIIFVSSLCRMLVALPIAAFVPNRRIGFKNNMRVLRLLLTDNPLCINIKKRF